MYRIVLGGSFDPIHRAHLQMAMAASMRLTALGLPVTVSLLPTAGNPFKDTPTPGAHRLAMLKLATQNTAIAIDEREIHLPPPVFTIDTLRALRSDYADDVLIYLIGQDSLNSLPTWKGGEQLADLVKFWVFSRVGEVAQISNTLAARLTDDLERFLALDGLIYQDDTHIAKMASSTIRRLIGDEPGQNLDEFLDPAVIDYIAKHKLYQSG